MALHEQLLSSDINEVRFGANLTLDIFLLVSSRASATFEFQSSFVSELRVSLFGFPALLES